MAWGISCWVKNYISSEVRKQSGRLTLIWPRRDELCFLCKHSHVLFLWVLTGILLICCSCLLMGRWRRWSWRISLRWRSTWWRFTQWWERTAATPSKAQRRHVSVHLPTIHSSAEEPEPIPQQYVCQICTICKKIYKKLVKIIYYLHIR